MPQEGFVVLGDSAAKEERILPFYTMLVNCFVRCRRRLSI